MLLRARGSRFGFRHPAQYVTAAFAAASLVGGLLLWIPAASAEPGETSFLTALFTATSAVCVTGLAVVDTGDHWSTLGEWMILLLIQVGGLGIMTLSSLLFVLLARRLGLRQRLIAAASTGTLELGDVRRILLGVVRVTVVFETLISLALFLRLWVAHDEPVGRAAYLGVFHAVSAFNNAGFSLFRDNLMGFQHDPVVLLLVAGAVVVGGLGFPVWVQIGRRPWRVRSWDLHTKLTVATSLVLLAAGWALFTWWEWTNPDTLGGMSWTDTAANGFFHSAIPRTAGFNSVDIAALREPSQLLTEVLMFIGGGSGSTAGGIKVTTFALLGFVIWAEVRGEPDVVVFRRRVPTSAQRQALTVALLALVALVIASMVLLATSPLARDDLFFESVSALGTVGLSTGITPLLSESSQLVVIVLMLLGRVGPPTLFAALVLRRTERLYRYPEERPIIG